VARPPFDPNSPGARRLAEAALSAREWEKAVPVTAHTRCSLIDDGLYLEPGQRADVPIAWAKSLVARGAASYVD
jgi:hypothetical protein